MPAKQRGRIEKLPSGRWSTRYYDEHGVRRRQGSFDTKTAAGEWLESRMADVLALRSGEMIASEHRPSTVAALVDVSSSGTGRPSTPPRGGSSNGS